MPFREYWKCLVDTTPLLETPAVFNQPDGSRRSQPLLLGLYGKEGCRYSSEVLALRCFTGPTIQGLCFHIGVPYLWNTREDSSRQHLAWCSDLDGCQLALRLREPQGHGLRG